MKQIISSILLVLIAALSVNAQITNSAPYCYPSFNTNYNMMSTLTVKGTQYYLGPVGSATNPNFYLYYNNITFPSLTIGDTASFAIDFHALVDYQPRSFAVWIDFNQDSTFDVSELVIQNSNTIMIDLPQTAQSISKVITIPASAVVGTTRMRIIRSEDPSNLYSGYDPNFILYPCPQSSSWGNTYGCTYDFDVIINQTVGSEDLKKQFSFSIYPNPVINTLTLLNSSTEKIISYSIHTLNGSVVLNESKIDQGLVDISTSALMDGFYFLKVHTASGKTGIQAFNKR